MSVSRAEQEKRDLALALSLSFGEHKAQEDKGLNAALQESKEEEIADPRAKGHLSLSHYPSRIGRKDFFKVKVPGDGNCGFYAISLGIINLLVQDKLKLSDKNYLALLELLKAGTPTRQTIEARIRFYETGEDPDNTHKLPRLQTCVPYLKEILAKIDSGELDSNKDQLKNYILEKMRSCNNPDYFLESVLLVLGPTLRTLTVSEYQNLQAEPLQGLKVEPGDVEMVVRDCKDAYEQQLSLLANFFDFTFQAYLKDPNTLSYEGFTTFIAGQEITHPIALTPEKEEKEDKSEDTLVLPPDAAPQDEVKQVPAEKSKFSRRNWFEITDKIQIVNSGGQHWDLLLPRETLQRPPFLFSHNTCFPSFMIEDQLDWEVTSEAQYLSRLPAADQGQSDFARNSYLLTAETTDKGKVRFENPIWRLRYINQSGEHENEIKISEVVGLSEIFPRLSGEDPGSLDAGDKQAIQKVIEAFHRTTLGLAAEDKSIFDAKKISPEIEIILKKARTDKEKLNTLLDQINLFEKEIKSITYQREREDGERFAQVLKKNINGLMDDTIAGSEKIALYQAVAGNIQKYVSSRPEIPRDCWNIVYNILAGIFTLGLWHTYNRCKYKQWTLFHDFTTIDKPSFKALKTQFNEITAQLQEVAGPLRETNAPADSTSGSAAAPAPR